MIIPKYLTGILLVLALLPTLASAQSDLYRTDDGYVHFISEAPLETIQASSNELTGILDPANREFAFSLRIRTFEGFNSGLQREHFNENYMNSEENPKGTFTGKIVEQIDFGKEGKHMVRAKGKMNIAGIAQERIIKADLTIGPDEITIEANFTVLLSDHNITIPRIVRQKISEEIAVTVEATLTR